MPKHDTLSTPISEAFVIFKLHCKSQRYRPKTLEFYHNQLSPFFNWLGGGDICHIDQVTSHHIRAYLVQRQTIFVGTADEREASGYTIHAAARAIRTFFNFCVAEEWLEASPMKTVKMPRRPKKILAAYTPREIKSLLNAAKNEREKTIIYLLLDTGVRASECASLRVGDVNWENNSITVRAGKGEKDRLVYFGAKTARCLIKHMRGKDPDHLICANSYTGQKFSDSGLRQLLRRLGKRADVHCNAHKFRRTFAINSLRNGMNVYLLAKLMGHEDITILKPYLDILDTDAQAGQFLYGVVDNL